MRASPLTVLLIRFSVAELLMPPPFLPVLLEKQLFVMLEPPLPGMSAALEIPPPSPLLLFKRTVLAWRTSVPAL